MEQRDWKSEMLGEIWHVAPLSKIKGKLRRSLEHMDEWVENAILSEKEGSLSESAKKVR